MSAKGRKKAKRKLPVRGLERVSAISWRWSRMIEGKRHRVVFKANSEAEAIQRALEYERRPELVTGPGWEREVLKYIDEAESAGKLSRVYAEARRGVLLRVGRELGLPSGGDLTEGKVRLWIEGACVDRSAATRKHYLLHVRGFTKWLVKRRMLMEDVTRGIELPAVQEESRERFLPVDEVTRALDFARAEGDPEMELILLLGCECGMRKSELTCARGKWVDLENGLITIPAVDQMSPDDQRAFKRKGKEGRRRKAVVPMSAPVREWFARNGVPEPYLIKPEKRWAGGRYRYDFRERWERFCDRAGLEDFHVHDMRRTFGTNRVSHGVSLEKVANWLGIDPATAWKHYAKFIPADPEIERGASGVAPVAVTEAGAVDLEVRLAKLKALEGKGLITPEDAEVRRREILGEL